MGIGMHMLELRRIRASIFSENDKNYPSVNLYDFIKAVEEYEKGNEKLLRKIIIPAEIVSEIYPVVEVKEESLGNLLTGKPILFGDLKFKKEYAKEEIVCVFSKTKFIGMYEILNSKNSQENTKKSELFGDSSKAEVFGTTRSQAVPTHREIKDFIGQEHAFAKPKFVLQPLKN